MGRALPNPRQRGKKVIWKQLTRVCHFLPLQAQCFTWTSLGRMPCTSACLHWGESCSLLPVRLPLWPHCCLCLSGSPLEPGEQPGFGALSPRDEWAFYSPKGFVSFPLLLFWALISLSFLKYPTSTHEKPLHLTPDHRNAFWSHMRRHHFAKTNRIGSIHVGKRMRRPALCHTERIFDARGQFGNVRKNCKWAVYDTTFQMGHKDTCMRLWINLEINCISK